MMHRHPSILRKEIKTLTISQRAQLISLYERLLKAWNDQDAKGRAALHALQAFQVGFKGSQVSGLKEIEKHHSPILFGHLTHQFVHIPRGQPIKQGRGARAGHCRHGPRTGTKIDSTTNAVQTALARKHKGKWKVELFQNTPARLDGRPKEVKAMRKELQAVVKAQL